MHINWNLDTSMNWNQNYEDLSVCIPDGMMNLAVTVDEGAYTVRHAEYWVNGMDDDGEGVPVRNTATMVALGVNMDVLASTIINVLGS